MNRKKLCSAVVALLVALQISAGASSSLLSISGGISKTVNARWTESFISMNTKLSYDMDVTDFTMIEGKICNTKAGLALGVNADINNNYVGSVNRVMGYIGLNRLYARFQNGKLDGIAKWNGTLGPGQTVLTPFKGSLTHVDLLYWQRAFPMYFGVGYTAISVPVEIMTYYTRSTKEHSVVGIPVIDTDYSATYYAFLFGFDTFTSSMLYPDDKDTSPEARALNGSNSGFGLFMVAQDRIGVGNDHISAKSLATAQALNGGKVPIGDSFFSCYLENTSSIGIRWRGVSRYGSIAIGVGYELACFSILDITGGVDHPGILGLSPQSSLARYGPIVRLYMQW